MSKKTTKANADTKPVVNKKTSSKPAAPVKAAAPAVKEKPVKKAEVKSKGKLAVTKDELKVEKKAKVKVEKEEEVGRRLARARSTLSAGLEAAMKGDSKTDSSKEAKPAETGFSLVKPTVAPASKKTTGVVSFDSLNLDAAPEQAAKKPAGQVKTTGGKVSFDDLMANANIAQEKPFEFSFKK